MGFFNFKKNNKKQQQTTVSSEIIVNSHYVRVNDRVSIYANQTNTYISPKGQLCIDFEESIIDASTFFKESICPYCGKKTEMPKMKKSCPHCKQKIYVRDGGIQQGKIAMTEEQYIKLKKLKDEFYNDRAGNPNYGGNIIVDNPFNKLSNK